MARLISTSGESFTATDDQSISSLQAVQKHLEDKTQRLAIRMPRKIQADTKEIKKIRALSVLLAIRQFCHDYSLTEVSVSDLLHRIPKSREYVITYLRLLEYDGAVVRRRGQRTNSINKRYPCDLYSLTGRARETMDTLVEKYAAKYPTFFVIDTSTVETRKYDDIKSAVHHPVGVFDV
jgi:hypothetical protein